MVEAIGAELLLPGARAQPPLGGREVQGGAVGGLGHPAVDPEEAPDLDSRKCPVAA